MTRTRQDYLFAAQQAASRGDIAGAQAVFEEALAAFPDDPELHANAGSFALKQGNAERSVDLYRRAVALAPQVDEVRLDLAIALSARGANAEALEIASELENSMGRKPRYWSVRANAARSAGQLAKAAEYYDKCLELEPKHPRALHGRARVALARGEDDMLERFDQALGVLPSEADLWLARAQALDAAGSTQEARALAGQLVDQVPHWIDALNLLAQLRSSLKEEQPEDHFTLAQDKAPQAVQISQAHIRLLANQGRYDEAARIARAAVSRFPGDTWFQLAEATNLGMAGHLDEADRQFSRLTLETPGRALQEGRHLLRRGEYERAEDLLLQASEHAELTHSAHALLGILWRITGDERNEWLHGQKGLVAKIRLPDAEAILAQVVPLLDRLHDTSSFPLGQSLRGGTQTRHILFERHESELAHLHRAIGQALEDYREGLAPEDEAHPLLRHRDTPWALAGSWSVRLRGGGDHHASHIHPQGLISSALYLVVPDTDNAQGLLEIGRPPHDLGLDLGPIDTIDPEPGYLALFPSTLFHGTTPFTGKTRMTVAFDVVPAIAPQHG